MTIRCRLLALAMIAGCAAFGGLSGGGCFIDPLVRMEQTLIDSENERQESNIIRRGGGWIPSSGCYIINGGVGPGAPSSI